MKHKRNLVLTALCIFLLTGCGIQGEQGVPGKDGINGKDGVSIVGVSKTSSAGNVDTYTITYSNGSTSKFTVTNGEDGKPGVQGEKGDDGHTPTVTIGANGNWYVDGQDTGYAATGPKGDTGANGTDGVSIVSVIKTGSDGEIDTYTITYSDGNTSTFTIRNGVDGNTPVITIGSDGNWYVNGVNTGVKAKGDKGDTGVSVVDTYIDENGDLICEMSDGTTINAGHVKDVTKHNVNFYVDDELVYKTTVEDGAKLSAPSEEVTAGYTINYWNSKEDGGYRWLFSAYTVISDLDLYADFTYNDYTITYVDAKYNIKIDDQKVTYDKPYSLSTIENQTGWTFSGWKKDDGELFDNSGTYRIASDLTLYADWTANQYKVTLDPNQGSVSSTEITATYDSQYELPTPTREYYTFLGWYDKNDKKVSSKATWKQTEDVTYTAKWTNVQNTYSFDAGDGTCNVDSMVIGWEDAYKLPTPTPASGFTFCGWYLNDTFIPQSGESWTYSNAGGILVAKYITGDGVNISYGLYPQSRVSDETLISALDTLTTVESNGWYLYDGSYYAKANAKPYGSSYEFNDGTTIVSGITYWFKCEPITWKMLASEDGTYSLVSTELLDAQRYHPSINNYKNSEIRTWLNGTFYNTAFSLDDSYIQTVEVDNSAATTSSTSNTYACENTYDNVYLLSYQDYINTSYFANNASRCSKTTDWARANGAYMNTGSSYYGNGYYWTRSPYYNSSSLASYVNYDGYIYYDLVSSASNGVRPAITIKL